MGDYTVNDGIEEVDEGDVFQPFSGREGTIYLIDVGKYVNDPEKSITPSDKYVDEPEKDQFRVCLDCIEADLLKSILINPRDLVSVVFYNTLHSPEPEIKLTDSDTTNPVAPSNCAILIPMKPLSTELIQYFKSFKESEDFFDFTHKFGSSEDSCFSEALWLCSRLVIQSNYKLVYSKVILFTNNELPHADGTQEQQVAFVRAKDFTDNNISVDLVPMVDEFDMDKFYKEFLSTVMDNEPEQYHDDKPADKRYFLLNRLYRADYKKSCLRHLNFELADGVSMPCDIYSFTRNAKKPNSVKMYRATNEIVIAKRSFYVQNANADGSRSDAMDEENDDDSGPRKVLPGELYKCLKIGGKEVVFSPDEMIKMKTLQSPGLRLLGFKPLDTLQPRWMIKHCLFLRPNEKKATGSTTLFLALWEKCIEKEVYALCTLTVRRATTPKYVALVPHTEDVHGKDGFCIITLPMETNVGVLDAFLQPLPEPTAEQVSLMEKFCKKLRFKYWPDMFSNPSLASFFTNLEALVYDEEAKDIEDLTWPQLDKQDERIRPFLEAIQEEFGSEAAGSAKRAYDGAGEATRPKAPKKDLSLNDIEQAVQNGRMESVTVQHLKDFLQSKNARFAASAAKKKLFEIALELVN